MVRKQLYLSEAQDQALKERAAAEGISEAEVVRRALDQALLDKALSGERAAPWRPGRTAAITGLKKLWAETSSKLAEPFDREDLYRDRLDRQLSRDRR